MLLHVQYIIILRTQTIASCHDSLLFLSHSCFQDFSITLSAPFSRACLLVGVARAGCPPLYTKQKMLHFNFLPAPNNKKQQHKSINHFDIWHLTHAALLKLLIWSTLARLYLNITNDYNSSLLFIVITRSYCTSYSITFYINNAETTIESRFVFRSSK